LVAGHQQYGCRQHVGNTPAAAPRYNATLRHHWAALTSSILAVNSQVVSIMSSGYVTTLPLPSVISICRWSAAAIEYCLVIANNIVTPDYWHDCRHVGQYVVIAAVLVITAGYAIAASIMLKHWLSSSLPSVIRCWLVNNVGVLNNIAVAASRSRLT